MPRLRPALVTVLMAVTLSAAACTSGAARPASSKPSTMPSSMPSTGPSTAPSTTAALTPAAPAATPTAHAVGLEPQVGPLFAASDAQPHGCSASVVHSPGHDLIITAAHCVSGSGVGQLFAPDYRDGTEPFGTWRVVRAWASPGWTTSADPDLDVAVLQVGPRRVNHHLEQVEDLVGAETLGTTPPPGARVTVVGYTHGIDDRQITCTNVLSRVAEFPSFSCHGYLGGTSGSPFLTDSRPRVIVGLVSGRDLGGCYEAVSYSSPFGAAVAALLARAVAGDDPDSLPSATSDC